MKWTREADDAISGVPFFVRNRVRRKVEEEASRCGMPVATMDHVRACQKRFLKTMEHEVKGWQVETCFGPGGCPNRAVIHDGLAAEIEKKLASWNIRDLLKERVGGALKLHHEFKVSISDCPNACSRPHIADIGLIGASHPDKGEKNCSGCEACLEVCREKAVVLCGDSFNPVPVINVQSCLA
jgi:anaerobic sulfite reductase subunit C